MATAETLQQRVISALGRAPQGASPDRIAEQLGIDAPSVHGVLLEMEKDGCVERWNFIPARYRLASQSVGSDEAKASMRLRKHAWPIMKSLHGETALPVSLHQLVGVGHTVVERYPHGPWSAEIAGEGARYDRSASLTAGATSVAFMAFAPTATASRWGAQNPDGSLTAEYRTDLERVRRDGFATSAGRRVVGAGAVTAPILSHAGQPMGALCLYGLTTGLTPEKMKTVGPLLAAKADQVAALAAADEHELLLPLGRLGDPNLLC